MIPDKYNLENVLRSVDNPRLIREEVKLFTPGLIKIIQQRVFKTKHKYNDDPIEEDWDNLIILDACRFDCFQNLAGFDNIEYKIINSSTSPEFMREYFNGKSLHDTVYVTANPKIHTIDDSVFYAIVDTNRAEIAEGKSWSPDVVYETALEAFEKHPNKRMIIHFMQPHAPYFGGKAERMRDELRKEGFKFWVWNDEMDPSDAQSNKNVLANLLAAAKLGHISKREIREVYDENINLVLEYAIELSEKIGGKTVITSDHGEMLGEMHPLMPKFAGMMGELWGHGERVYTTQLRQVPWLELESGQRKKTVAETPLKREPREDIQRQLKALGYK